MKQLFILFMFSAFFNLPVYAQKGGRILGTVQDVTQKTIESATITLLRADDSTSVKLAVASTDGNYVFENIVAGNYLISVTAVGYQKRFSSHFKWVPANGDVRLSALELMPLPHTMGTVVVVARKPLVEQKVDRMVVNVEASPTYVGSTALEVLEKSPGLSVDKDGNISLKGKEGVLVLVDGRPTQLSGADLATLLRNLNASQLDQIEIMTNPPARFDAAGNAGVVNIKTKKNKQVGYNGTVGLNYSQGMLPKYNESLNFNFRQGKWNLFTNLSYSRGENNQFLTIQRNFRNESTKQLVAFFDQKANIKNTNNSYNGKVGADYAASKNTTIGVVFSGFSNPNTFRNQNLTNIYNNNRMLTSQTTALATQKEHWKSYSANVNFRQILDTAGKELTADVDYITYRTTTDQMLSNYYFSAQGNALQKGDTLLGKLPRHIDIYSGRIDYVMPLDKKNRLEAGIKTSQVKTDNNAIYDTVFNGSLYRDQNRSNHFLYEEAINAAYVNLSGKITEKWNAQVGLRLENTVAKGNQVTTGEKFVRNYIQLFPTSFLQYMANDNNTFGLNYGRRIRRPNYESLNPFITYLDRYTYQQGNPNLRPQFSHNVEVSHTYKGFLTTTLNYTRTNDVIQQVLQQNEATNETFMKQGNLARQQQVGIAVSANKSVNNWWTNSIYINVFTNRFVGMVNNQPVTAEATTLMLNGTQQFKLTKKTTAELSGWFRSGGVDGVLQVRPMGALNLGFSQLILNDKGSIRLNVRDVLYTQQFRASAEYANVDTDFQERRDSRVVTIGLTYRFAKGKTGGTKQRMNSASDEQNRVGQ